MKARSATEMVMAKAVSFSKRKKIERSLREAIEQVAVVRASALGECRCDPKGTDPFAGRAFAIRNYCGARQWVRHYREILNTSQAVKMANQYTYATLVP
jgi:hypothetical protein